MFTWSDILQLQVVPVYYFKQWHVPLLQYPFIEQSEHIVDYTEQNSGMSPGQEIVPEYPATENV